MHLYNRSMQLQKEARKRSKEGKSFGFGRRRTSGIGRSAFLPSDVAARLSGKKNVVEKIHHRHQGGDWERSDDPTERLDLPGEGAFNRLFGGVNRFDRSNNPAERLT